MALSVHLDGLRLNDDHFCIGGFVNINGVLTHKLTRVYYKNLVNVGIVKGEDRNQPSNVVFLRLLHFTNQKRHVESLRFAEHPTYSGNIEAVQPWLASLNEKIRPMLAPHLDPKCISPLAIRVILIVLTKRTERLFHRHIKPILVDVDLDYRVVLVENEENAKIFIKAQRISDWDGIMVVEKMRMLNHICSALLSRVDRAVATKLPVCWISPDSASTEREPCQLLHCTTRQLKLMDTTRAQLSLSLGKPSYTIRHVCHVELWTGKHMPLTDRLCFGPTNKSVVGAKTQQSNTLTYKQKKTLSSVRSNPVTVRLSFILDVENQSTTQPRRIRWRRQRYNNAKMLGGSHSAPATIARAQSQSWASSMANQSPGNGHNYSNGDAVYSNGSETVFDSVSVQSDRFHPMPDFFSSALTSLNSSTTALDEIDDANYITDQKLTMENEPDATNAFLWRSSHVVNEIPSIRKDLPEHTNTMHHWTRIQDRFVAIYVDLLGCPDSTDTESGSIMRLTFVKCRDKGSKLTVDDCIKSVNIKALRIEPLAAVPGSNTCYVDGVDVGIMPLQCVLTNQKITLFSPFDMSTLIVPPSYDTLPSNETAPNGIRTMRVEDFHVPSMNYGDRQKDIEIDNTNGYVMCPPAVDENDDEHENFFESMSSKLSTLLQRKHFPILRREERLQSTPV